MCMKTNLKTIIYIYMHYAQGQHMDSQNRLRKGENKRKILMAKYAKSVWRGQNTFKSHSNKHIADKSMLFIWFKREHSYFLMVRV